MYRRILIPTDGRPGTERAVEHALDLAERYDAALYVLYVVDTTALPLDARAQQIFEYVEEQGRRSEMEVVDRAEELGIDPVVSDVREGPPHEAILEYVEANDVDLIVMGTHGRQGLDRYLLGSVTERVVRSADVPVLTVRTEGTSEGEEAPGSD
jgi:nucleotide-binding universal stress UspA family protein